MMQARHFFGGRALELALHVMYARGADRILGREYPGAEKEQIDKERKSHDLFSLYRRICALRQDSNIKVALDNVYQRALHKGICDIVTIDGVQLYSYHMSEEYPFREESIAKLVDGAEMTLDHLDGFSELIGPLETTSTFMKMPYKTFEEFLHKADAVYYDSDFLEITGMLVAKTCGGNTIVSEITSMGDLT